MASYPLAGVRVVDFTQAWAGTSAVRVLCRMGAEVIKIESSKHVDITRNFEPQADHVRGIERGGMFHELNLGRLDITLDLHQPKAVQIVKVL